MASVSKSVLVEHGAQQMFDLVEQLDGTWHFQSLAPTACKVVFDLRYEFAGPLLERLIGPVFNHIATTFIDAFVKRADDMHKPRS